MGRYVHTEKTAETFNRILKEYLDIDSDSKLEALGLEYDDYRNGLGLLLDCLRYDGVTSTDNERVANWLKGCGCVVIPQEQEQKQGRIWIIRLG